MLGGGVDGAAVGAAVGAEVGPAVGVRVDVAGSSLAIGEPCTRRDSGSVSPVPQPTAATTKASVMRADRVT